MKFVTHRLLLAVSMLTILSIGQLVNADAHMDMDVNHWHWQLSTGQLQQDYHEVDTNKLTTDGVLNSETGSIPSISLSVENWMNDTRIANTDWTPYGRLDIHYASGKTDYDGYLQSGSTLTPYQTTTDNTILKASLAMGANKAVTDSVTLTQILAISHHQWERGLQHYTEDFRHTALLAGGNIDWQPSTEIPLTLQLTAQAGKIIDSEIDVANISNGLGLKQDIGNASIHKIGATARYQLANNITLNAGISRESWQYEQSDMENGYLYPDSENEQTSWQVGLGWGF